jgi:two-component system OmpR family sensor kinase/two-component system sensor histidine kinase BaeS
MPFNFDTPDQEPWHAHRHGPPAWVRERMHKRRFLFRRFAFVMLPVMLLFLISLGVVYWVLFKSLRTLFPTPAIFLLVLCGIPFAFMTAATTVGGIAFRRLGAPLADVMAAADAVAEGDFSARVRENLPGELGQLARSFNRMAAELARTEQQRRNLTADVAHELRTPLQIIQGNLESIQDGVYEPSHEILGSTLEETRLLTRLVNDLQTLSLAEAGQLPLHPMLVSAADLVEDVKTSFTGQAAVAEIELSCETSTLGGSLDIRVDPDRLDQVLSNLVANAIRHTPAGGKIVLRARPTPTAIHLEVQDSGSGIAPEDLPFVFDRFYRADPARVRQPGSGSGLGLAIARQLVQAHGGQIRALSAPGEGTLIQIDLPLPQPNET